MPHLQLGEFIKSVKDELLAYQREHEGEAGFFLLKNVDLEISLTVTSDEKGKINLYVVELGTDAAKAQTQTVRVSFGIFDAQKELKELLKETAREKFAKAGTALTKDEIEEIKTDFQNYVIAIREGGNVFVKPS